MKILLVDNGSLEPAAVLALREVAAQLSARVGREVFPVSMAHSDKIPAAALGPGGVAQCVEAFLREQLAAGEREFAILPFFIGPSRAVTHALPKIIETHRADFPELRVKLAPPLHAAGDLTLARILAERVRAAQREIVECRRAGERPLRPVRVALVDHGSPTPAVTAVRDEVAAQLAATLREDAGVAEVAECSMERRPGPAYAFNEPLLETLLARDGWRDSTVIVAPLFLLPGRHAGAGGDIAQICTRARTQTPSPAGTRSTAPATLLQTAPLSPHPQLIDLLTQCLGASLGSRK